MNYMPNCQFLRHLNKLLIYRIKKGPQFVQGYSKFDTLIFHRNPYKFYETDAYKHKFASFLEFTSLQLSNQVNDKLSQVLLLNENKKDDKQSFFLIHISRIRSSDYTQVANNRISLSFPEIRRPLAFSTWANQTTTSHNDSFITTTFSSNQLSDQRNLTPSQMNITKVSSPSPRNFPFPRRKKQVQVEKSGVSNGEEDCREQMQF